MLELSRSESFAYKRSASTTDRELLSGLEIAPRNSVKPKGKRSKNITKLLETCESYMNWLNPLVPLTEENLRLYIQRINSKSIVPNEQFERVFVFKFSGFEHVSYLGALCYFYLSLNKLPEANNTIGKAREFILQSVSSGFIPEEFVESFDYVWNFLRLHACIKEYEQYRERFQKIDLLGLISDFDDLTPISKAGVYGLKQYFYRLQNTPYEKQIEVIKQAIALQPDHYEWHYAYGRILRNQRRAFQSSMSPGFSYSFKQEIEEIYQANKLAPEQPVLMLAKIQLLSEIARTQFYKAYWEIVRFGPHTFCSMIILRSYIKEQAQKILQLYDKSVRVNLVIARIFSRVLPQLHQDYIFAKNCLERTLELYPFSSRANMELGLLFLTHELNFCEAEIYLTISINTDARNYPALLLLIQLMMHKVVRRKEEILNLIEKQLVNSFWTKRQIGNLHFLRAYVLLANSNPKGAIDEFIVAYTTCKECVSFYELPFQNRRFNWQCYPKSSLLTLDRMKQEIRKAANMETDPERREILAAIREQIQLADEYDQKLCESRFKIQQYVVQCR